MLEIVDYNNIIIIIAHCLQTARVIMAAGKDQYPVQWLSKRQSSHMTVTTLETTKALQPLSSVQWLQYLRMDKLVLYQLSVFLAILFACHCRKSEL